MKIVALEEHFVTRDVREAWKRNDQAGQDDSIPFLTEKFAEQLEDLADARISRMDASGVDVQVLSLTTPGVQNLGAREASPLARQANDLLAATVRSRPERFEGFATLPTASPLEAAEELDRAVSSLGLKGAMLCGRTRDRNLDHPDFMPIFETAARLRVPLYLHPQIPRREVRESYYSGFSDEIDLHFATGGFGWHAETGIQFIRLILAGVFDRLPDLQIILGHWGEVVTFYSERVDALSKVATGLDRPVGEYMRGNLYVTPSGIFSHRYLSWAVEALGVERILFSVDDPFQLAPDKGARRFLDGSDLSLHDRAKIAHGNWERLSGVGKGG